MKRLKKTAELITEVDNKKLKMNMIYSEIIPVYRDPTANELTVLFSHSPVQGALIQVDASGKIMAIPLDQLGYNGSEDYFNKVISFANISALDYKLTIKLTDDNIILIPRQPFTMESLHSVLTNFSKSSIWSFYKDFDLPVFLKAASGIIQTSLDQILNYTSLPAEIGSKIQYLQNADGLPRSVITLFHNFIESAMFDKLLASSETFRQRFARLKDDVALLVDIYRRPPKNAVDLMKNIFGKYNIRIEFGGSHKQIDFPATNFNQAKTFPIVDHKSRDKDFIMKEAVVTFAYYMLKEMYGLLSESNRVIATYIKNKYLKGIHEIN